MSDADTQGDIRSDQEAIETGYDLPGLMLKKIKRAKEDEKDWRIAALEAVKVYEGNGDSEYGQPAFNILHSNIEIIVPSLYNSTPIPDVRRRYGDADQIAKQVIDCLERGLSYSVDQYDFDGTVEEVVRDGDLAGRGTARVRYDPEMRDETDQDGQPFQSVGYQRVTCEHVPWNKWGHGPARCWEKVPWVYFEHDLTHDDLVKLGLDEKRIKELSFNNKDDEQDSEDGGSASTGVMQTVNAFEVWVKATRKVYWIANNSDEREFLAVLDDPLQLEQFYPVPKPLQPLRNRQDLTPIVPFSIYKEQVKELDKVTKRINGLIGQLRVRGLYDKRLAADLERLKDAEDGYYEPAEDASQFVAGAGGLEKAIAHWPLAEIVAALNQLYVQREQIKQTIYEITGLSDVLRGATDPRETLGAQQLKAQTGSTRLNMRQRDVANFCRDLFRMKAELMSNHFTIENLSIMTGMDISPEAYQLMQDDRLRSYRVDVETDSTIRADVARSQEQMNLFLQGTAQYAQSMATVLQLEPGAKQPIVALYAAFARNFKLGKSAEDALEQMVEAAGQPQQEKPDPEAQKAEAEQQRMQMQAQMDQAKMQADMEAKQADLAMKQEMAEIDRRAALEQMELKRRASMLDLRVKIAMAKLQIAQAKAGPDSEEGGERPEMPDIELDDIEAGIDISQEPPVAMDDMKHLLMQLAQQQSVILQAISAPKRLQVERDQSGRVAGAVVAPEIMH